MIDQNRKKHLYALWNSFLLEGDFPQFDRWLKQEFAKHSSYGSRDRRWYADALFAEMRFGYLSLFLEENLAYDEFTQKYPTSESLLAGWKSLEVENFFTRVQSLEHFEAQNTTLPDLLLHCSIPHWFLPFFEKRISQSGWSSDEVSSFLKMQNTRPPLWLRLNNEKYRAKVLEELQQEGHQVESHKNALKISGAKSILNLQAYQAGEIEIQDLASQFIGQQILASKGQSVWDCCAGGGGKTLQIASILKNKGVVYASDIRAYKLVELKKRADKAGFTNVQLLPWDGEKAQKDFDWVLVDAPCSSTGTWRRNPDAKYRVQATDIERYAALQLSILQKVCAAVRSGGHLVYATCSWTYEENEGIVRAFLEGNKDFSLLKQSLFGAPQENSDTMFAAVLQKLVST